MELGGGKAVFVSEDTLATITLLGVDGESASETVARIVNERNGQQTLPMFSATELQVGYIDKSGNDAAHAGE